MSRLPRATTLALVFAVLLLCQSATVAVGVGVPMPESSGSDSPTSLSATTDFPAGHNESNTTLVSRNDSEPAGGNADAASDDPVLEGTYLVDRTPDHLGTVRVTYRLVVPDTVQRLVLTPYNQYTGIDAPAFTPLDDGSWL